jgi:hypothetical protein
MLMDKFNMKCSSQRKNEEEVKENKGWDKLEGCHQTADALNGPWLSKGPELCEN